MNTLTFSQRALLERVAGIYPNKVEFRKPELKIIADQSGISHKDVDKIFNLSQKVRYGVYNLQAVILPFQNKQPQINTKESPKVQNVQSVMNDEIFVPEQDKYFVRWGHFSDVEAVVASNLFYPVYVTGLSGNGKTMMVEQACAKAKKQYLRVQITPETDEDDLIGGFRLVNGETVFAEGPVIKAMKTGALLLIDELDRGSNKIMCLQGVLEGKPVLIKKTGEVVKPAEGFNVIATANTKGKGSEDGRFIAANIIDEAFLERFTITMEQPYPTSSIEKKIIRKHMDKFNKVDDDFAEMLTIWSETIRKTFEDGGVDDLISTRRLCHIVQTFSIFGDRQKAIELCVNRFDVDTKEAFLDLYSKVDVSIDGALDTDIEVQADLNELLNEVS
jgi:MoxR-like ATPase